MTAAAVSCIQHTTAYQVNVLPVRATSTHAVGKIQDTALQTCNVS